MAHLSIEYHAIATCDAHSGPMLPKKAVLLVKQLSYQFAKVMPGFLSERKLTRAQ